MARTPKLIAISTQYDSLDMVEQQPGRSSTYAVSEAVLNVFIRHVACEEKRNRIVAIPIHPGLVATRTVESLVKRIGLATFEPEERIRGVMEIVDQMGVEDEVRLWRYDAVVLKW